MIWLTVKKQKHITAGLKRVKLTMKAFFIRHFGKIDQMNRILLRLLAFFFITFNVLIFLNSPPQSFLHAAYQFHFSAPVVIIGIAIVFIAPENLKKYILGLFTLILLGYHLFYTYFFTIFFLANAGIIGWIH